MNDIVFEKVSFSYSDKIILQNFDLTIPRSQITTLSGVSGCGKTTILKLCAKILQPQNGQILGLPERVSMVFQESRLPVWLTVEKQIQWILPDIMTVIQKNEMTTYYLESTGLLNYRKHYPKQLSGGMQQRLNLARAFAYPSELLLMDEPFKQLDLVLKTEMMTLFQKLWEKEKRTVLLVTHDESESKMLSNNNIEVGGSPLKKVCNASK